jgi:hypothetical protein
VGKYGCTLSVRKVSESLMKRPQFSFTIGGGNASFAWLSNYALFSNVIDAKPKRRTTRIDSQWKSCTITMQCITSAEVKTDAWTVIVLVFCYRVALSAVAMQFYYY